MMQDRIKELRMSSQNAPAVVVLIFHQYPGVTLQVMILPPPLDMFWEHTRGVLQ